MTSACIVNQWNQKSTSHSVMELWETSIQKLEDWLQKMAQTEPSIQHEIINGLQKWHHGDTTTSNLQSAAATE